MSASRKLLNRRTIDYLLGTLTKDDASSFLHNNHHPSIKNQRQLSSAAVKNNLNLNQKQQSEKRQQQHCSPITRPSTSVRLHSTTTSSSPTVAFTSTPTKTLKRGASTQAQQVHQQQTCGVHDQEPAYEEDDNFEPLPPFTKRDASFSSDDLVVIKCPTSEMSPKLSADKLVFGHVFTDHMFRVDWDVEQGWSQPLISKVHNLDLHPGAKVLHYALEAFEGAKAYRGHDNKIRFFRLDQNVKRLLSSARRLALPEFNEEELMKCIHRLVQLDQDWIPQAEGRNQLTSLYIRPTIMGIEPSLGVASSKKALLYVLLSPVGPYFKTGFKPISLYADPKVVRAWPGGAGNTKLGSNYAPTIAAQREAEKLGLQQVLWLFGDDMKLTEVGTMNIFVAIKHRETGKVHLITPPLSDGLILPGITRKSILELAQQWDDVITEERYVTIGELRQLLSEDRVIEMFGAGTACIVCPISSIQMRDGTVMKIPYTDVTRTHEETDGAVASGAAPSSLTRRILKSITDIQYGRVKHPWATELIYS